MDQLAQFKKIIKTDVPLAMHTWLQLGGRVEYFAEPRSEDELVDLMAVVHEMGIPARILGTGTNVLVSDAGIPGIAVRLTAPEFCKIETNVSEFSVVAGGGVKLGRVITSSVYEGLAGLEGLIGIPGTVGGAVHNNVSTSEGDIGQWVESVTVVSFDGKKSVLSRNDIVFGDRSSTIENAVIASCRFRLMREDAKELSKRLQKIWILRKKTQPIGYQGAGWLFKDPVGLSASELIDSAGLKGTRIGGAVICDRNSNFVLIEPECSSDDVSRLIRLIQTQVRERSGVDLESDLTNW